MMINELNQKAVAAFWRARSDLSHKGDFGKLLIAAGSRSMPGAAMLCASAALRTGAGTVTVAAVDSVRFAISASLPECMVLPCEKTSDGGLSAQNIERIAQKQLSSSASLIGPGAGCSQDVSELVRCLLNSNNRPVVVDADGLNSIAGCIDIVKGTCSVLTPHIGEMARLCKTPPEEVARDSINFAVRFAKENRITLVLKSSKTVVCDESRVLFLEKPNSGLAKGGAGDVLSGIIASLATQGTGLFEAAALGVYLHSAAGEIAAKRFTKRFMLPGDVISCLPEVFRQIEACT